MNQRYVIPNLRNAILILNLLSDRRKGDTLSGIARHLQIPRTTVLRILTTLELENFLKKDGRVFTLGSALQRVGIQALASLDIRGLSAPILKDVAQETGETSHLIVPSGDNCLILEVCDSPHPLRVASRPGTLAALYCSAAGKVFLAHCLRDRFEALYANTRLEKRTPMTITSTRLLQREVDTVLRNGYGLDNEEYYEGVRCVAAPVRNACDEVVAALGITGTTTRFTSAKTSAFSKIVITAADKLSEQLGWIAPRDKSPSAARNG